MITTSLFRRATAAVATASLMLAGTGMSTVPVAFAQDNAVQPSAINYDKQDGSRFTVKFVETPNATLDEQMQIINNITTIFGSEATHRFKTHHDRHLITLNPAVPHEHVATLIWILESQPEIEDVNQDLLVRLTPPPGGWRGERPIPTLTEQQ